VFPDSTRNPASGEKQLIGFLISFSVAFNLVPPEIGVGSRPGSMLGTTMPKTTINKDGDHCWTEYNVRDPG
jgi:hypothetical protein